MRIDKLMTRDVKTCSPSDPLARAAQILWEQDCGSLPVVDGDRRPIGILTDRDICMAAFFKAARLDQIRVADAMSRRLVTCQATESLAEAEERMVEAKVRRLPVVDREGRLEGILALADLARRDETRAQSQRVLAGVSLPRKAQTVKILEIEVRPQPRPEGAARPGAKATPKRAKSR